MPKLYKAINPYTVLQNAEINAHKEREPQVIKDLQLFTNARASALNIGKNPTFQNILDYINLVKSKLLTLPDLPSLREGLDFNQAIKERNDYINLIIQNFIPSSIKEFNNAIKNGIYTKSITLGESDYLKKEFKKVVTVPIFEHQDERPVFKVKELNTLLDTLYKDLEKNRYLLSKEDFKKQLGWFNLIKNNLNNLLHVTKTDRNIDIDVDFNVIKNDVNKYEDRLLYLRNKAFTEILAKQFDHPYADSHALTEEEKKKIDELLNKSEKEIHELGKNVRFEPNELNKKLAGWTADLIKISELLDVDLDVLTNEYSEYKKGDEIHHFEIDERRDREKLMREVGDIFKKERNNKAKNYVETEYNEGLRNLRGEEERDVNTKLGIERRDRVSKIQDVLDRLQKEERNKLEDIKQAEVFNRRSLSGQKGTSRKKALKKEALRKELEKIQEATRRAEEDVDEEDEEKEDSDKEFRRVFNLEDQSPTTTAEEEEEEDQIPTATAAAASSSSNRVQASGRYKFKKTNLRKGGAKLGIKLQASGSPPSHEYNMSNVIGAGKNNLKLIKF